MFLRRQFTPYCVTVQVSRPLPDGRRYLDEITLPALHFEGRTPHGRNGYTGSPDDWGPDAYGYTDFDDYHLEVFGA